MKVNTHINMVILDDYHSYFNDMAKDKRLPDEIKLIVYNNHFKNSKELINNISEANIVVGIRERTKFPKDVINQLPNLKFLVTTGLKNASYDLEAATKNNIVVSGTPGSGEGPVDLTWGLIISLVRKIHEEDKLLRACLLYTSPSPRDRQKSRMPSSA